MSVILFTRRRGSLYDVTSCLAARSHVPFGGLDRDPHPLDKDLSWTDTPDLLDKDPSWTEIPCTVKSGQYTYYWNAFLLPTAREGYVFIRVCLSIGE